MSKNKRATFCYTPELLEDALVYVQDHDLKAHGNAKQPFKAVVEHALREFRKTPEEKAFGLRMEGLLKYVKETI